MLTSNISKSAVYSVGDINSKNVNFEIPELTVTVVKNNVASHAATMLTQEVGDLIIKATCNAATATSSSNTLFQAPIRRVKFQGQKLQEIQTGFPKFLEEVGYVMANRQTASTGGTMQILSYSSMKSSSLLNQILGNLGTPAFSNSWTFTAKNTIIPQPLGNIVTALTASKDVRFARSLVSKGVSDVVFVDYYPSGGQGSVFIVQRPKTFDTVTTDYSRATPTIARNNYAFPEYKYSTARSIYASIIRYSISSQVFSKWWTNTTNYTQILGIAAPKMNNATTKPTATAGFTSGFAPLYVYYATMCFSATDSSSVRSKYEILGKIMSTGTTFKSRVVIASTANTRLFEQWSYNLKAGTAAEKAVKLKMALNNAWAAHGNGQLELVIPPAKKETISTKGTENYLGSVLTTFYMVGRSRLYQNKSHYCTYKLHLGSVAGGSKKYLIYNGYNPVGTLYMRGTGYVYDVNGTFFTNGTANQFGETIGFGQNRAWITSGHGNISHNGTNIYIPGGNAYATHGQPVKGMVACVKHNTDAIAHKFWRWNRATMYAVPRRGIVDSSPISFNNAIQIPPEYTTATTTAQNIRLPSGWYAFVGVYNGSLQLEDGVTESPLAKPHLTLAPSCPKVKLRWATDDLPNAYSTYDTVFMAHPHIWADDNGEVHFVSYAKDFSKFEYSGIGNYKSSTNTAPITEKYYLSVSWTMANVKSINKNLEPTYLDNNCPATNFTGLIACAALTYHVLGGLVVNHAIPNRPFVTGWRATMLSNATTLGTVAPDERYYHKVIAWGDHADLATSFGSDCGKIPFNGTILGIDNNGKAVVIPDKESREKHTFKPTPMFTRRPWKDRGRAFPFEDNYNMGTYGMGHHRKNWSNVTPLDLKTALYKPQIVKVGKDRDYKDFETVYCNPVCMDMGFNYLGSGNPLVITPFSNTNEKTIYFPQDTVEGGEFRHDGFLTGDLLCLRPNNVKNRMLSVAHIPGGIVSNIAYQTDGVIANGQYVYDNKRIYFLAGDGTLWGSKGQTSSFSLCIDTGRIGYGVDGVKIIQDICFANDGNVRYDGAWRVGRNTTAATMTNPSTLKTSNVFSLEQAHWEEGKDYEYTGYRVDCGGEQVIIGSESPNMIDYAMDIKAPAGVVKEILEPRIMKQAGKEAIMVNAETRFYPQVIPLQDKMLMKISGANTGVYTVLENRIKPDSETPTQKVKLLHYKDR